MELELEFLKHIKYISLAKINDSQKAVLRCSFYITTETGHPQRASLLYLISINKIDTKHIIEKIEGGKANMLKVFKKLEKDKSWTEEFLDGTKIIYYTKDPLEICYIP